MGLNIAYENGQTPLDEDEREGLIITSVTTRTELNEVEQRNIEKAMRWTNERRKKFTAGEIITEGFICELHKKMLGDVWQWAGTFRNTNKNIGVDKYQIAIDLRVLMDDCRYWISNKTFSAEEIAIRFKHRIVSIHCFANGNGRHSRLMADIIIEKIFDAEIFSWGDSSEKVDEFRDSYLYALREADKGNYKQLIKFARS